MTNNEHSSRRTRHIDIEHHVVHDNVEEGIICIVYVGMGLDIQGVRCGVIYFPHKSTYKREMNNNNILKRSKWLPTVSCK